MLLLTQDSWDSPVVLTVIVDRLCCQIHEFNHAQTIWHHACNELPLKFLLLLLTFSFLSDALLHYFLVLIAVGIRDSHPWVLEVFNQQGNHFVVFDILTFLWKTYVSLGQMVALGDDVYDAPDLLLRLAVGVFLLNLVLTRCTVIRINVQALHPVQFRRWWRRIH